MLDLTGASISLPVQLARRRLRVLEWLLDPRLAIGGLLACLLAVVLLGAEAASFLTPSARGAASYPMWMAGPFHGLLPGALPSRVTLQYVVTLLIGLMLVAYVLTLRRIDRLPVAWVIAAVLLAHVVLLLAPPLFSTDVFGYISYGRLGALHGLNPYSAVPADGPHTDPSYVLTNWHHLSSPYGPLFTLLTYPLAYVSVPVAFWMLKVLVIAADLGVVALVWRCARLLGRPPAAAVAFVALNPLVLLWMVGADHNDSLMMLLVMVSVYLSIRAGRGGERPRVRWLAAASGLALVAAVAIKPSAAVLVPVVLVAGQWRWKLAGMALGAATMGAVTLAAFGPHIPSLSAQSNLVVPQGLPNLLGLSLGLGGETSGLHAVLTAVMLAAIAGAVLYAARRPDRWLAAGAAAVLALVLALSWTQAWYVFWLLPLAALAGERRLRTGALVVSALLFVEFMPAESTITERLHIRPGATPLGVQHQKASDRAFY